MKKILITLLLIINSISSVGQELKGVWLNYNNRVIDKFKPYTSGGEGLFMDFDNLTMGHIKSDSLVKIEVRTKKNTAKIKVGGLREIGRFRIFGQDSLELDSGDNKIEVFRKLDLSHRIPMTEKEIANFLIANSFDSIQGIKGVFSKDQFFLDKTFGRPHVKNQFENKNWDDAGYWLVKKINENAFLIFTIGQLERMNIFQILAITNDHVKLIHLQEDDYMRNFTELKTSH